MHVFAASGVELTIPCLLAKHFKSMIWCLDVKSSNWGSLLKYKSLPVTVKLAKESSAGWAISNGKKGGGGGENRTIRQSDNKL